MGKRRCQAKLSNGEQCKEAAGYVYWPQGWGKPAHICARHAQGDISRNRFIKSTK